MPQLQDIAAHDAKKPDTERRARIENANALEAVDQRILISTILTLLIIPLLYYAWNSRKVHAAD